MRPISNQALGTRIDVKSLSTRIDVGSLSGHLIFGGIMLVVALVGTADYGLQLRFGFF